MPAGIRAEIETFLEHAKEPALLEPGEEPIALTGETFALEIRGGRLTLEAWDERRNLARRISAIAETTPGRMELVVERFARREGRVLLLDMARPAAAEARRRSSRLVFRERFRLFLRRQFPQWKLAELSTEADLEHSLSPVYPRALLRHGQHAWAALGCPPGADPAAMVSFGLIWLDYLRAREPRVTVEGLALYVPAGGERPAALRLLCLNPDAATFLLFSFTPDDFVSAADPRDHGNFDTRLETCRRATPHDAVLVARVAALPDVEYVRKHDGRASLRVRGIEFARVVEGELLFGLEAPRPASGSHFPEIEQLASELAHARSPETACRAHPLYRRYPEAWLESQARASIRTLDAALLPDPVYGQVPAFAGGDRGVLDLLAIDRTGRLAVIELKASADLHLPMQALDYWIRVKWHLDRGEFSAAGYFPGIELRPDPPRLLLVSPALEFHPTTETLLRFVSPAVEVERVGVGSNWRARLEVMFRLRGAERPA